MAIGVLYKIIYGCTLAIGLCLYYFFSKIRLDLHYSKNATSHNVTVGEMENRLKFPNPGSHLHKKD